MAHTPGIGALIGSTWTCREALTPEGDRTLATAMARWWFETGPAPGTSWPVSFIAEVVDGWTGDIVVAVGDATYTITPASTTSAAEVLDRIVRAGSRRGGDWSWSVDAAGVVTISSTVPFELVLSGTVRTRLGLTGIYAGQLAYTAAGALHLVVVPSLGISLSGAEGVARGGGVTQAEPDQVAGGVGLQHEEDSGTVRFWGTQDELVLLIETLDADTWDVALGGACAARVRIQGVAREPWGKDPTKSTLSASVVAVSG